VRAKLKTKINVFDRIVKLGHFGHNKFVVICDSNGAPQRVLTGSTDWTSSGLCTQANNGLIIDDPSVAADFLAAWQRIKAAGNITPRSLWTVIPAPIPIKSMAARSRPGL
jgi:phosphatidylserine/phosphatidylglycerophosphate/cardiolipin synthase-like enzyme